MLTFMMKWGSETFCKIIIKEIDGWPSIALPEVQFYDM